MAKASSRLSRRGRGWNKRVARGARSVRRECVRTFVCLSGFRDAVVEVTSVRRCKCNSRRGLVVSSPGDISPLLRANLPFHPLFPLLRLAGVRGELDVFSSPGGQRCWTRLFFFFFFLFRSSPAFSFLYVPRSRVEQALGGAGPTSLLY